MTVGPPFQPSDAHIDFIRERAGKMSARDIGVLMGLAEVTVRSYAGYARISLAYGRRQDGVRVVAAPVSATTFVKLREAAHKHNCLTGELAAQLLDMIAEDDLFAAVLDK
jgi:hypothetical protein